MALGTSLTVSFDAKRVQRGLQGILGTFKSIGTGFAKMSGGLAALGAAGVVGLGALTVKLNAIGEEATASDERLKNIVKSMGLFGDQADDVAERLLNLADAQGRLTGIDDDTIALTQSKLLTFKELAATANVVGGAFDRATTAALDMAQAGFGEASQNAVQLGKALNDPIRGITSLAKSGITFTAQEKKMIAAMVEFGQMGKAQDVILKAIEKQVGGTAAATATASSRIKVSLAQVVEEFAKPFSAGFNKLPGQLEGVFPALIAKAGELGQILSNAISDSINGNFDKFAAIGKLIGDVMGAAATAAFQAAASGIVTSTVNPILKSLRDPLGAQKASGIATGSGLMPDLQGNSFADLFEAAMINRGVKQQAESIRSGSQAAPDTGGRFRYARPGESSIYSDGKGNKLIEILSKIERNTQTGASM